MMSEHDSYDRFEDGNDQAQPKSPKETRSNERVRRAPANRSSPAETGFVRRDRASNQHGAPQNNAQGFSRDPSPSRAPSSRHQEQTPFNAPGQHRQEFDRRASRDRFGDDSRGDHRGDRLDERSNTRQRPRVPNPMQTRDVFEDDKSVRLHKWLSEQGVGSRREVEEWIVKGEILIDGMVASLGAKVYGHEKIMLRGQPLNLRKLDTRSLEMVIYHKPAGEIVTYDDPHGRPTVFDHLPRPREGKWVSVGRLDFNSEGLLILTNSGDIAHRLMHPSFQLEREYAVRVRGELSADAKAALLRGVALEGEKSAAFLKIEDAGGRGSNHWYHVTLTEGRYREVRRMFEAVTYEVNRLIRIRYGQYQLPPQLRTGKFLRFKGEQVLDMFNQVSGNVNRPAFKQSPHQGSRQGRERHDFSNYSNERESGNRDESRSHDSRHNPRFENRAPEQEEVKDRKGFSGFLRSRGDRQVSRDARPSAPREHNGQKPPRHHD